MPWEYETHADLSNERAWDFESGHLGCQFRVKLCQVGVNPGQVFFKKNLSLKFLEKNKHKFWSFTKNVFL